MNIQKLTDSFVLIVDPDQGRSMTNAAAEICRDLDSSIEGGLAKRRIYYRDTMGRFDEMRHEQGEFKGFAPCSDHQQEFLAKLVNQ